MRRHGRRPLMEFPAEETVTDEDALGQLLVNALGEDAHWVLCYLQEPDAPDSKVRVVSTLPPEQLIGIFETQAEALRAGQISRPVQHEATSATDAGFPQAQARNPR